MGPVAFEIGQPPHTGGLIAGPLVDGVKVRAAIEKLGAISGTVDGQPGLTWGAEGSQHPGAFNQFGVGPGLGEFDRAVITAHTVIAAPLFLRGGDALGRRDTQRGRRPDDVRHIRLSGRRGRRNGSGRDREGSES
jgi:hypothetical protein